MGVELSFYLPENDILPVEVKSESNVESRSLKKYKEKYGDKVKLRIRFSLNNLRMDDDLLNIPLFMADYADKIIGMALEQLVWRAGVYIYSEKENLNTGENEDE